MNNIDVIATIGPSCNDKKTIREMIQNGATVFRLFMAHGKIGDHLKIIRRIREIDKELGTSTRIMGDLQGPKFRLGEFEKPSINFKEGQSVRLDLNNSPGTKSRLQLPYPEILESLEVGYKIKLNHDRVEFTVTETGDGYVQVEVTKGGRIHSRQGFQVPGLNFDHNGMTEIDREHAEILSAASVDMIALSFAGSADDVHELRGIIGDRQSKIIAKIETQKGLTNINEIVDVADGVMVARGDLGANLSPEDVPNAQKSILDTARAAGKYSIVATEILMSMFTKNQTRPTRAEVTDIQIAVEQGASALMLGSETSQGEQPVNVVKWLRRLCDSFLSEKSLDEDVSKSFAFAGVGILPRHSVCYTSNFVDAPRLTA